ncbi:MAG: ChaN family lipoprotein [Bacteroidetes bacterium]|jgi:uncharacterized iron-regulated protein|nr:ChaN family lipoprotein [Bacteroidota bacterium]
MRILLFSLCLTLSTLGVAQNKTGYVIYNAKGKKVSYKKMVKSLAKSEVTLFGEYHDNPISHWLELEVTKDLSQNYDVILGAEMIERDNQDELDLYLKDSINQKAFDTTARLWNNHKTDYKPLVDFAKDSGYQFIATNIPRRYASLVYKKDFNALDTLSDEEKSWIAPMPMPFDINLPRYQAILKMMGAHGSPKLIKAQAVKDATMAHSIVNALNTQLCDICDDIRFIHYNGSFHSDYYEGIYWYIQQYRPETSIATIATVTQADITKLDEESKGRADFIICVDEDMTRTY